jgi:hypothetical protein
MKATRLATFVFCLLPVVPLSAQPARRPTPPPPSLPEVAFLAGHWEEATENSLTEEIWTSSSGNSMAGMLRHLADGKVKSLALLSIREEGGVLVLRIRRFDADLAPREEKALVLKLVDKGDRMARFEGSAAGPSGPATMIFKREGDGLAETLTVDGKTDDHRFQSRRWGGFWGNERFHRRRSGEGPSS